MLLSYPAHASTGPAVKDIVCPMKDYEGNSVKTFGFGLEESEGIVSYGKGRFPAIYEPSSVEWRIVLQDGQPVTFSLDRYSGELVASVVNPTTGNRLVLYTAKCVPADLQSRKF